MKATQDAIRKNLGFVQWFYFNDRDRVEATIEYLRDLGVTNLRTGISWIEFLMEGGDEWYDWMVDKLHAAGIDLMVMVCYTPDHLSETGEYTGAPKRLEDYADFVEMLAKRYRGKIREFQLWNEPNNRHYWNQHNDRGWDKFAAMVKLAAPRVRANGASPILGGPRTGNKWFFYRNWWQPDANWFGAMHYHGVYDVVDALTFQVFPGMWVSGDPDEPTNPDYSWGEPDEAWLGWDRKVAPYELLAAGLPVINSETGVSAFDWNEQAPGNHDEQAKWIVRAALESPVRTYWYSLLDIPKGRAMIGGKDGQDPRNPYFGIVDADGNKKPAYFALKKALGGEEYMPMAA